MSAILYDHSTRFFPFWQKTDTNQLTGLINLIEYIFSQNQNANKWCEIGSMNGESSSIILGFTKVHKLYCVDSWSKVLGYDIGHKEWSKDPEAKTKISDFSPFESVFYDRMKTDILTKRCIPIKKTSIDAANDFDDASLDVIYIDADHRYEFVIKDLTTWISKVNKGGFLCGHDYSDSWPEVKKAVNDFVRLNQFNDPIIFNDTSFLIQI
jgi:hypothetical protein